MFRKIILGLFVVAATVGLASTSSAGPISKNNPIAASTSAASIMAR
jgi:hypothetical protein